MGMGTMGANRCEEFKQYLTNLERSENTIDVYTRTVNMFFKRYREVNRENMLDFKKQQLEKWKPATAFNRVVAMNQYCLFIGHSEYCVKGIKIHKKYSVENVITIGEYNMLLDGLRADNNERGYWMVKYLAKTGARVSEFIRLTKEALDMGYCEMWTKGKMRRIYIPQVLIEESRDYFSQVDGEFLFPKKSGGQITARGVSQDLQNWGKKYGIRKEVMHPHSFRHLFAIEFLKHDKHKDITLLADLMGHSSVETTAVYLKLSRDEQIVRFNEASNW